VTRKKDSKNLRASDRLSNPFKSLKGFSVSAEQKTTDKAKAEPGPDPALPEEPVNFSMAMAQLGVKPMGQPQAPREPAAPAQVVKDDPPPVASDEELFLAELGKLDCLFADRFPEEEEAVAATPRRMKLLRQGKLVPEATLDLHGANREEARGKVRCFLENSVYQGKSTVLIITGWGRGGGGHSVLRDTIEQFLVGPGRTWVAEWGRAPKNHGGEGALVVFLRAVGKVPAGRK
jgi:DNA-nicking Smr family endonuclease